MIGLVTDSNAMLPESLVARLGVRVVPLTVTVDGSSAREDAALDIASFYRQLRDGATITTAAPSPGELAAAYRELLAAGAAEIVSVHVGSAFSGTVNAAHVASRLVPIPVHVVDSGAASFALGCCVWAASDALACGHDSTAAAASAAAAIHATTSVFTIGEVARARTGGRLQVSQPMAGVPVIAMDAAGSQVLGAATDVLDAVHQMTRYLEGRLTRPVRIGVGDADHPDAADTLADALGALGHVRELVRYQVGPTVAAHTGAGTFGAVAWELDA